MQKLGRNLKLKEINKIALDKRNVSFMLSLLVFDQKTAGRNP